MQKKTIAVNVAFHSIFFVHNNNSFHFDSFKNLFFSQDFAKNPFMALRTQIRHSFPHRSNRAANFATVRRPYTQKRLHHRKLATLSNLFQLF